MMFNFVFLSLHPFSYPLCTADVISATLLSSTFC
jgi:hypothetical protein